MAGNGADEDRLDSWKEIAAHLRRDASTVRRWEKAGLPVHRHQHKVRAAVYAYKSELNAWWKNGQAVGEPVEALRPERPTPRWVIPAGALAIAVIAAAGWLLAAGSGRSAAAPLRVTPFTSYTGSFHMPAFSPDGERIAFSWTGPSGGPWSIYVKAVGGGPPLRLTSGPGEDNAPTWSPDGTRIAFLRGLDRNVGIYEVPALGGPDRKLADVAYGHYFNLQWTRDGKSIVLAEKTSPQVPFDSMASSAIFLLSIDSQSKRQLTFPTGAYNDHRFALSPDGATLAFLRHGESDVSLFTVPINGGEPKHLYTERAWAGHVVWAADGRSLIFTSMREGGSKLWRIPIAGGEPEPVSLAEEDAYSPTVSPLLSRLAYVREYFDTDLMRVSPSGDAGAAPEPFAASARIETGPAFSPDGRSVAFFSEQSGRRELWIARADGNEPAQMTDFFAWDTLPPTWSPDGRMVLFYSGQGPGGSGHGLFLLDVATREVRRMPGAENYTMPSWAHDGRSVFVTIGASAGHRQIARIPASGGPAVVLTRPGTFMPRESPDGSCIYYLKENGGIWRMSETGGQEALIVPDFAVSQWSNWSIAPSGIYYLRQQTAFNTSLDFLEFATGRTRHVLAIPSESPQFNGGITVSPDGKSIIYTRVSRSASDIMLVENFR